jgi:O-succinylbenzoic acid--CoA ligase
MADASPLAHYLEKAAHRFPQRLALHHDGECWTQASLWAAACALAARLDRQAACLSVAGDSLTLARHAWAGAIAGQPFWPLPPGEAATSAAAASDSALIISTSGSEGPRRAVRLSATALDTAATAANQRLALGAGDLWLNCLPLYHIGGQSILWRCARAGAAMLLHDGFRAARVAEDLARYPVSHISLVPAMLAALLDLGSTPPASLRVALIGGAALSAPLYERATAAGWPLWPSYGMSESAALVAVHAPTDGPWQPGRVGRSLAGMELAIADNGRIRLRGQQLMLGYLDGGGLDNDGWLTSGDLGEIDADGQLTVIGRADDMLISGGRNVHPQEIESCLAGCPGIRDVAVSGLPDPVWGDLIVALVVGSTDLEALQAHARHYLPAAALPRRITYLDSLPHNAAGKLDRPALRRLAAGAG